MTSVGGLLEVKTDGWGLKYDDSHQWLVADGDGIVIPMGGMKKYKISEILDVFGVDLGTLITLIEAAEVVTGVEILPNGTTADQLESVLTHASWLSPYTDDVSIKLTGTIGIQRTLMGALHCPQVLTAYRGGLDRIPFYDNQSLTSSSVFKYDTSAGKMLVPDISVTNLDRTTVASYVVFGNTSSGSNPVLTTVNSGSDQVYWFTTDHLLVVSKLKLTNFSGTGTIEFANASSPFEIKGTATANDFTWDDTNKLLKAKFLQLTDVNMSNQEVPFVNTSAASGPSSRLDTSPDFKWDNLFL